MDAGLDQAFSDSDNLRRAETVLVDLAIDGRSVLDQADRYAEKQRLLAMQAYNGSQDEAHTDSLAGAWASGSWYKLLNHRPDLAEQYAREALRLKDEDLLSPNSDVGKVASANLAHALLFRNRIDEAEKIYNAIKDTKIDQSKPMKDSIAGDYSVLRSLKFIHPGMCTIGKLLGDAAYAKTDCAAIN